MAIPVALCLRNSGSQTPDCWLKLDRNTQVRKKLRKQNSNSIFSVPTLIDMDDIVSKKECSITEYDEQLVRRLIEKITVYDEKVIVEFKSGTSVDIHR